jgi:hypothetical protein
MTSERWNFGDDPSSLTPTIMDGLRRLKSFDVFDCRGDLLMIAEHAPIQNLSKFSFDMRRIDSPGTSGIVSAIAMKCRSLKSISIYAYFESWVSIYKIVEYCCELEEVTLHDFSRHLQSLKKSGFVAIASLSCLKSLELKYCDIDDGAFSPLARCKGLRHLSGANIKL